MGIDRIITEWTVEAMVGLDTFDLLVARVKQLLSHERRIAMTQRYTWVNSPADLFTGLTVDTRAYQGGIREGAGSGGRFIEVHLRPGIRGFGFSAYPIEDDGSEAAAWRRYHTKQAEATNPFERRRNMTQVRITGGLPNSGPGRDDLIVIRAWNDDGVCDERVVGFDPGPGSDR